MSTNAKPLTPITVADLPLAPEGKFLYCCSCREHYSAARGDYFMHADDTVLRCCDNPLVLARQRTMIEEG